MSKYDDHFFVGGARVVMENVWAMALDRAANGRAVLVHAHPKGEPCNINCREAQHNA